MKNFLGPVALVFSAFVFFGVAALWTLSYQGMHSVLVSARVGDIRVLWDKGIVQVDVVRGDTQESSFEWDAHRRSASGGRATLNMFKPRAGVGRFFADLGFAQWSYSRYVGGWFSEGHPGWVVFCPFWFVILFPGLVVAWQLRVEGLRRERYRDRVDDDRVMFGIAGWGWNIGMMEGWNIGKMNEPASPPRHGGTEWQSNGIWNRSKLS